MSRKRQEAVRMVREAGLRQGHKGGIKGVVFMLRAADTNGRLEEGMM